MQLLLREMFYLNVFKTKCQTLSVLSGLLMHIFCIKHMVSYVTYATFEEFPNMDFEIINGSS